MAPSPLQCLPRHPSTLIGILSLVSITHPGFFSPLLQPQEHTAQPLPWLDPPSTTSLLQHQPQTAAPHPPPGPCSLPGLPVGRWKMLDAGGAAKSQRELSSRSRCILRAGGRAVPGRGAQGSGTCSGMYPNGWGHLQCLLLGMPWGRWMALLSWGLTDIYCAKGTSPRRTSSQQNVPTLLPSATHLLPSPAASFGELPVPSNTSSMRPAPVPAASSLRHSFPIAGLRAPERSNLCHSAAGKRGHKDMGGSEWVLPASPFPVTIPGPAASRQPHGPTVPWRLLPWCAGVARAGRALAPCPVAVSSCFLLFFFFPPSTPPRGTHREEEAQFPIVSIFLFIVLLGKTQRAQLTNIPLFAGHGIGEFREDASTAQGSGSPLDQQGLPLSLAPSAGVVLTAPADIRTMVNFMPPPPQVSDAGMLFPSFGAPVGCARAVLYPTGLILHCEKTSERLPHRHFGAGMLLGTKQGHTMGLCSGLPYLLPPPGSISKGGGSFSQRKHKTSSICPRHQGTQ